VQVPALLFLYDRLVKEQSPTPYNTDKQEQLQQQHKQTTNLRQNSTHDMATRNHIPAQRSQNQNQRRPVFSVLDHDEVVHHATHGSYYKNIRQEWASLCCTPKNAKYHESLAFTRSLGDFYLHTFGLTHEPDVVTLDLVALTRSHHRPLHSKTTKDTDDDVEADDQVDVHDLNQQHEWVVLMGSDGIWDCWRYGDAGDVILEMDRAHNRNASAMAHAFMQRNKTESRNIFGAGCDNMTVIVATCTLRDVHQRIVLNDRPRAEKSNIHTTLNSVETFEDSHHVT
jgi:hypothetical protein